MTKVLLCLVETAVKWNNRSC